MTKDKKTETPAEISEDKLDDVSGGPHFRTWDSTYYDFHGGAGAGAVSSAEITDGMSNTVMKVRHDTAK